MKFELGSRKNAVLAASAVGTIVVLGGVWLLLVSPQRSKSADLDRQIAAVETQLAQRRLEAARPRTKVKARVSDLYRLTKAMPDRTDMSGIMIELSRVAGASGVRFQSITPAAPVQASGYVVQPLDVVLQGRFTNLSRFLRDVRTLVTVRKGKLEARGRLFSVDRVDFGQGADGFPAIEATVRLNAFVFGGSAPAAAGAETVPESGETATPTDATTSVGATP